MIPPHNPGSSRRATLLRLALAVFLFNTGYSVFQFLFNFFLASQQIREARMGLLAGAMVLGGVLGALPASRAASRAGLTKTLTISLLFCSLFLVLRVLPCPFAVQWLFAALSGFFLSGWTVLVFPLIAAVEEEGDRASAFQILYGIATGSGCAGALVGGYFPTVLARWLPQLAETNRDRLSLCLGASLIALSAAFIPHLGAHPRIETAQRRRPTSRLLRLLGISALWACLLGALNPFAGIYFQSQFQMSIPAIGRYFFTVQAIVALGLLIAGVSRLGAAPPRMIFLYSQLFVAIAFFCLSTHTLRLAETAYLVFMLAQQLSQPALQSLLMHSASAAERNSIAGWNALFTAIFQSVSAQIFGLAWNRFGYSSGMSVLAAMTLLSVGISAVLLLRRTA